MKTLTIALFLGLMLEGQDRPEASSTEASSRNARAQVPQDKADAYHVLADKILAEGKEHPSGSSEAVQIVLAAFSKALEDQAHTLDRLAVVDECTKVYRRTIDKKNTDLTVRESAQIKVCTELDLYPLDQKEPF